jgi:hypothetical protein
LSKSLQDAILSDFFPTTFGNAYVMTGMIFCRFSLKAVDRLEPWRWTLAERCAVSWLPLSTCVSGIASSNTVQHDMAWLANDNSKKQDFIPRLNGHVPYLNICVVRSALGGGGRRVQNRVHRLPVLAEEHRKRHRLLVGKRLTKRKKPALMGIDQTCASLVANEITHLAAHEAHRCVRVGLEVQGFRPRRERKRDRVIPEHRVLKLAGELILCAGEKYT